MGKLAADACPSEMGISQWGRRCPLELVEVCELRCIGTTEEFVRSARRWKHMIISIQVVLTLFKLNTEGRHLLKPLAVVLWSSDMHMWKRLKKYKKHLLP